MARGVLLLAGLFGLPGAGACQRRAETPPEVARAYEALVKSLDGSAPGASLGRLRDFARRNRGYAITTAAEAEAEVWRAKLEPAYRKGRDLVRAERFDEAEAVLRDLAPLEHERTGELAREFLAFEFFQLKASRLMLRGDIAGAQAVARSLQVTLHSTYAEEGRYPEALTLDSPTLAGLRPGGAFNGVAAIEDYRGGADTFSFVLRGKDPRLRLRVTQSSIEEVGAAAQP